MPIPAAAAAAIAGGSAIAGSLGNIASTWIQNRKSRKFSEKMYDKQYRDNIAFWNMQNEYNTPEKQMERLRQAGLNPNLIYGTGKAATGMADKISTPDVQSAQFRTPDLSGIQGAGLSYLNAMYDFDIKQAQIDNLKTQNTVMIADAALKAATTKRSNFDLQFETDLRDISASMRKELLRKTTQDIKLQLNEDERRTAMNSANLQVAAQNILKMKEDIARSGMERQRIRAAINNLKADTTLKNLDKSLWDKGITRNDPLWMRVLVMHLEHALQGNGSGLWKIFRN